MPARRVLPLLASAALMACAAPPAPAPRAAEAPPADEARVLVKLSAAAARGAPDAAAVVEWARRATGLPVRYAAAVSPLWHSLGFRCREAECEGIPRALAADAAHFDTAEREQRRRAQ